MAVPSGLGSQVGIAEESVFGTIVTPTRFFEYNSESIEYDRERIESQAMKAGRRFVDRWVPGRQGGAGDVEFEVMPNGFGIVTKHMLGAVATTTPVGATLARLQTAKVGQLDGKSLTVQIGRPQINGTVDPYTYSGCKVNAWELAMETGGLLMCKLSLDVAKEDTATALAVASYPTANQVLSSYDLTTAITIGGVTYNVAKATIGENNNLKTDRYAIGRPTKLEQVETALRELTGTIDLDAYYGTTLYNLFVNGTEAAIVSTFTGTIIEAALKYQVVVTIPRARFDGKTSTVGGPDILPQSVPFKALYSAAASTECQIETQNTDAAA